MGDELGYYIYMALPDHGLISVLGNELLRDPRMRSLEFLEWDMRSRCNSYELLNECNFPDKDPWRLNSLDTVSGISAVF